MLSWQLNTRLHILNMAGIVIDDISSDSKGEITRILENKDSKNTKRCTKNAILAFHASLKDIKNTEKDIKSLHENLAKFFWKAKKKDGKKYKAGALQTLRNGLRRHYLEQLGVDIVNDKAFSYSTKVFKASVVDLRRQGLGTVQHHPAITKADMAKLYSGNTFVFDIHTPNGLLNKVWFEILYYLCRRGQENLRTMTKETFQLAIDSTGNRYIFQKVDEMDKNHRDLNAGAVSQGRMYEQKGMKHCFLQEF